MLAISAKTRRMNRRCGLSEGRGSWHRRLRTPRAKTTALLPPLLPPSPSLLLTNQHATLALSHPSLGPSPLTRRLFASERLRTPSPRPLAPSLSLQPHSQLGHLVRGKCLPHQVTPSSVLSPPFSTTSPPPSLRTPPLSSTP